MSSLRLTPGRMAWIVLLGLLYVVAPRPRPPSPEPQFEFPPPRRELSTPGRQFVGLVTGADIPKAREMGLNEDLFESDTLARIDISIPNAGLRTLRRYHWGMGDAAKEAVSAQVREGDKVYTNVAIHLKGSAGSFEPIDARPALTLNFGKFSPGQKFHGLNKIHLNNSRQDSSLISEQLCRELFNAAGIPTPRATQARVSLNGRDLGVYVLVEGANKQFLRRHFKDDEGVLYDGGFCQELHPGLEVDSGDPKAGRALMQAFVSAVQSPNRAQRQAALREMLDVDRFLSMVAMEILTVHWDGYSMNRNNYRVYHDPSTRKFVFLAHGLDQMFGHRRSSADMDINSGMNGMVTRQVLAIPELKTAQMQRIGELYTNLFQSDKLLARVDEISERMKPFLAESGAWAVNQQQGAARQLRQRIVSRINSVGKQLQGAPQPLPFNPAGEAALSSWSQARSSGNASFRKLNDPLRGPQLGIVIQGGGAASWRTEVLLEPGHYRFTGLASARGLQLDPAEPALDGGGRRLFSGVGLRLSGGEMQERLTTDAEGREVWCDFEIESTSQVTLVCEAKAQNGEAAFDAASLRLIRK